MSFEIWMAFIAASAALLAIPGPTITAVAGYAIGHGKSVAWATVPGVVLGDFTAMTLSLLGAGAILATSATLFLLLKIVGAAYLIWMGFKMWRTRPATQGHDLSGQSGTRWSIFLNCYLVTALNPKDIMFFIAFVPQFINANEPAFHQFLILEITFLTMVSINIMLWSVSVGHLGARLMRPERIKILNRIGGAFLIGAGLFTATLRRI